MTRSEPSSRIPEPENYFHGWADPDRVVSANVLVFERNSRQTLQQRHLSNRMHHRYVLMRPLETAGVVSVDGQSFPLAPGQAMLIAPYQFHHYIQTGSDALWWLFATFAVQQGSDRLRGLANRVLRIDTPALQADFDALRRLWLAPEPGGKALVLPALDALLTRLLHETCGPTATEAAPSAPARPTGIARIESVLIASVEQRWTLAEVARRCGMSERHLRTVFHAATGITPHAYRANYQLHRAMALMQDSTLSLTQIAEMCGFSSLSSFSRAARRMTDRSPRSLRQQALGQRSPRQSR